jgi:hypothetical protein
VEHPLSAFEVLERVLFLKESSAPTSRLIIRQQQATSQLTREKERETERMEEEKEEEGRSVLAIYDRKRLRLTVNAKKRQLISR